MEKAETIPEHNPGFIQNQANYLASNSSELTKYIEQLALEGKQTNPKSLCIKCWCFLSYAQKSNHPVEHIKDGVKPVSKYANMDGFTTFALENGHYQEINGELYYEKIKIRPPTFIQNKKSTDEEKPLKKMKTNNYKEEAEEDSTSMQIKLEKKILPETFSEESNSTSQAKPSKKRPHEVFFP